MVHRAGARLTVVCLVLLPAGCGNGTTGTSPGADSPARREPGAAPAMRVKVHVKDMSRRLGLG
jgi:hypothetical protein